MVTLYSLIATEIKTNKTKLALSAKLLRSVNEAVLLEKLAGSRRVVTVKLMMLRSTA